MLTCYWGNSHSGQPGKDLKQWDHPVQTLATTNSSSCVLPLSQREKLPTLHCCQDTRFRLFPWLQLAGRLAKMWKKNNSLWHSEKDLLCRQEFLEAKIVSALREGAPCSRKLWVCTTSLHRVKTLRTAQLSQWPRSSFHNGNGETSHQTWVNPHQNRFIT